MRFYLFYILLIFIGKSLFCQPTCYINGSVNIVSSICQGQTASLNANSLSSSCYQAFYLSTNFQNGLIGYYPFCGNCQDESISGNNFSASGGASLTADRFGNSNAAYNFNGTFSNMQFGGAGPSGNSARTITLWFNDRGSLGTGADSIASNLYCYGNFSNNTFFQVLHMSPSYGGVMKIDFLGSSITTTAVAGFNSWQFFAFVMDAASNYTTYINSNISGTGTININTGNLASWLGCSMLPTYMGPKYYLNGKMDEIFIYNRDLSQSEILQLYNVNVTPTTYTWSTGATTYSISVSPSATTIYTLSATNGISSCTASSTVIVSPCTRIEELSNNSNLKLYPNPALDELNIISSFEGINNSVMEIYNSLGELILTSKFEPKIKTQFLSSGLYLIKIYSPDKKVMQARFVKE